MDHATAVAILDLWVAITIGWYDYEGDKVVLRTTEEDTYYDSEAEAAEACIQTVYTWIGRNYDVF